MTSENTINKIESLQNHFEKIASSECRRFINLGIITKDDHHYYIDKNGKITLDFSKIALDIYYIKATNKLVGDIIVNRERRKAVFSKEMPKPCIDRKKFINKTF